MKNLRAAAAHIIFLVTHEGYSLSDSLPEILSSFPDSRDQALIQALCYGVCRRYFYLTALLNLLLDKPLKYADKDLHALLLVGLYQLSDMRIPAYAAVDDTVAATQDLQKAWAKGLVNAILRNFLRNPSGFTQALANNKEALLDHPNWLIGMLEKAWPQQAAEIMQANNAHPPLALRINQRRLSRAAYLAKLQAENLQAEIIPHTEHGIVLLEPKDVTGLPGFSQGEFYVQDGAAQLAAVLLALKPGLRVLDACAAPGGKTTHIAEQEPDLAELIAIDNDENRLQAVRDNLARLQLQASYIQADVTNTEIWWDGRPFDRILLDAPCSASGVIRRHPDIKLLRRPEDVQALVVTQLRMLATLWPCLKVGGLLVYVTCSIFPRENSGVLTQFLATHKDAQVQEIQSDWGLSCPIGKQILPGMHGMDGFYYACLSKIELA